MGIEIYYFSGTGNSMYIAKELQKKIPTSKITPIVSSLRNKNNKTVAKTVGFVFPIHYLAIPKPVKDFIKNINVDSAGYIFAIATRLGTPHTAFTEIDNMLKKKGRRLDAHFNLTMASNDPKYDSYQSPTEDEIKKYETVFDKELEIIYENIKKQKVSREKDNSISEPVPQILLKIIPFLTSVFRPVGEFFRYKSHFYADNKCIGCGTCEKVCLSKKIIMTGNKPTWQSAIKCFYCYACLNFCPKESVQIKRFTEKNGRYSHPYATAVDIAKQK